MTLADIGIILVLLVFTALAVSRSISQKKKGCGGCCSGCGRAGHCPYQKDNSKE